MRLSYSLILMGVALAACKPAKQSNKIASIDTVMQDSVEKARNNSCGLEANYAEANLNDKQKALLNRPAKLVTNGTIISEKDLKGILVAVPTELHSVFFKDFKGTLSVQDNAQEYCADALRKMLKVEKLSEDQKARISDLKGCWTAEAEASGNPIAKIVVASDYKIIRNTLIPLFTFFYSEYVIDTVIAAAGDKADTKLREAADLLTKKRIAVGAAMIKDINRIGDETLKTNLLKMYKGFFQLPDDLSKTTATQLLPFGTYVFAEAMDSRYCSAASLGAFAAADYTETFKAFTQPKELFGSAWFE